MFKRFRYEFTRSFPFFLTMVISGTAYWLILRQMLIHPGLFLAVPLLLPILIAVAFVVAPVVYVIINVNRELSQPSGLLTFLTPLAPWKMMVAKWLNFIVSFGLSFLVMRFLLVLFPVETFVADQGIDVIKSLVQSHHPINVPFLFLMGMNAIECLVFVLCWTLVLVLIFWILGWTEALYSRTALRRGKFPLRVVSFLVAFFAVDAVGAFLTTLVPWYIDVERFQLFQATTGLPIHFAWQSTATVEYGTLAEEMSYRAGTPVVLLVFLLVVLLFFLWRAQANWKKIDR